MLGMKLRSHLHQKTLAEILNDLESNGFISKIFLTSTPDLEHAFKRYKELSFASKTKKGLLDVSSDEITKLAAKATNTDEVKKIVEQTLSLKKGDL